MWYMCKLHLAEYGALMKAGIEMQINEGGRDYDSQEIGCGSRAGRCCFRSFWLFCASVYFFARCGNITADNVACWLRFLEGY